MRINSVETECETMLSVYPDETSTAKKWYDLALLIVMLGRRVMFGIGESEGFHRAGSSIQALTGRKIDGITGVFKHSCELTYQ